MEYKKARVALQPEGTEILKHSRSAFCLVLGEKFGCTTEIHNVEDPTTSSFSHSKATIVPEIKYSKQLSNSLKVSVWKDDLTTHKADAVVNAANENLNHGGGLALALSRAGGPKIQQCSDEIIKTIGRVQTGDVVVTPAGNLPCEIIIHAVGPSVSPNASEMEINKASPLLRKAIWNILLKTNYNNLQSIAIPAISSGLYNFPRDSCANIIVHTVMSFNERRNPNARSLEVRLVNNDDPSVKEMQRACWELLGQPDLMPTQNLSNAPTQSVLSSLDLGNVALHLKQGAIEQETADVIVNTAGIDLNLSIGLVSKAILHKAGSKIQQEIKKRYHGPAFMGAVLATGGYNLKCKEVYHTVCAHKSKLNADKTLYSVITDCLKLAVQNGYSSIHFPAIGTGNLGFEKEEVSQIMTRAVLDFSKGYHQKKIDICFVIFPTDIETLKAFEKEMASMQKQLHTSTTLSSTRGKSSGFHDTGTSSFELFAPSPEALREAQLWCVQVLQKHSGEVTINNNHVVYFTQEHHTSLMKLMDRFNVIITEFFREGKGGISIKGRPVEVGCATLEVEAMLCQAQEDFARNEEEEMQGDLEHMYVADDSGRRQQIERMSNRSYEKIQIDLDLNDRAVKEMRRKFEKCNLKIVKVEKIENYALKQLFSFNRKRVQAQPQHLYQCVKAQFCNLICRVGFQREYAPPKEQKYGAGIYFTSEVDKARSLWADNGEEYIYFIEAEVLTGKEKLGSAELIVPPPIGKDPLVRYDSVTSGSGIHIIFNGQQAYPKYLITCSK